MRWQAYRVLSLFVLANLILGACGAAQVSADNIPSIPLVAQPGATPSAGMDPMEEEYAVYEALLQCLSPREGATMPYYVTDPLPAERSEAEAMLKRATAALSGLTGDMVISYLANNGPLDDLQTLREQLYASHNWVSPDDWTALEQTAACGTHSRSGYLLSLSRIALNKAGDAALVYYSLRIAVMSEEKTSSDAATCRGKTSTTLLSGSYCLLRKVGDTWSLWSKIDVFVNGEPTEWHWSKAKLC